MANKIFKIEAVESPEAVADVRAAECFTLPGCDVPLPIAACPPLALKEFTRMTGVTETTISYWRRMGVLKTVNICGGLYVRAEDVADLNRRAASGELATVPSRALAERLRRTAGAGAGSGAGSDNG